MGTSVITAANTLNTHYSFRAESLTLERRSFAVESRQEGEWSKQKEAAEEHHPSPYIDIEAESVMIMQTWPLQSIIFPILTDSTDQSQSTVVDSSHLEQFPSTKALNYRPSKKGGGGVEFWYDNPSSGRFLDLLA